MNRIVSGLSDANVLQLMYDWRFWARDKQLPPEGEWTYWLIMAGRGFGKTRAGAEWVREKVNSSSEPIRIALVGATAGDVRDIMIEGESGLLNIYQPSLAPKYEPSKRRLTWPNGSVATTFTADKPDRMRGPQHHIAWCDEPASWRYAQEAWDMLQMGLRLGDNPQAILTTTPRNITLIRNLLSDTNCVVTRGSTYENRANLAGSFFDAIISRYEGTRLGRQELNAELLIDVPGALWNINVIDASRVSHCPDIDRIIVSIDPATTSKSSSDETGIIATGSVGKRDAAHVYVLGDYSLRGTPTEWATAAINAYIDHGAGLMLIEDNQGGEMVETTVNAVAAKMPNAPYINIKRINARRSKASRAEPVSALYEQGRVHHIGALSALEDQMCSWVPSDEKSPDRVDALVHAVTELAIRNTGVAFAFA